MGWRGYGAQLAEEGRFVRGLFRAPSAKQRPRVPPPRREHLAQFAASRQDAVRYRIDAQTVDDLELDSAVQAVFEPCSLAGRYAAHAALVNGTGDSAGLKIVVRQASPTLEPLLQPLRDCAADPLPFLFLQARYALPAWAGHLWLVPLLLLASLVVAGAGIFGPMGWLGVTLAVCMTAYAQIRLHPSLQSWKLVRQGLCVVLQTAQALIEAKATGHDLPVEGMQAIRRALQRSAFGWESLNDYLNLLLLREYRGMLADIARVERDIALVQQAWLFCADVDLLQALASAPARLGVPWADADAAPDGLSFEGVVHPGLAQPLPFSGLATDVGGSFISGQNAAGKSTLLRAVGVNALFLRAFGGAFCTRCGGEVSGVVSAITATDSMADRESLYFSELRRCRDILADVAAVPRLLVLIDEPFRGTNNLESLAASASVLEFLGSSARTVVVTHNVLLCSLLPGFQRLQVKRSPRRISVEPGVLAEPNGLALFDQVIDDPALSSRARHWFGHISGEQGLPS